MLLFIGRSWYLTYLQNCCTITLSSTFCVCLCHFPLIFKVIYIKLSHHSYLWWLLTSFSSLHPFVCSECWTDPHTERSTNGISVKARARVRASSSCNCKQSRSWLRTRTIFTERDGAHWNSTEWTVCWKAQRERVIARCFKLASGESLLSWAFSMTHGALALLKCIWKHALKVSKDPGSVFPLVLNCVFEKAQLGNGRLKCCSMGAGYLRSRC